MVPGSREGGPLVTVYVHFGWGHLTLGGACRAATCVGFITNEALLTCGIFSSSTNLVMLGFYKILAPLRVPR